MTDIIQLLPDSIANQIAAGEVVQRPSSVVKELLENAIDAQAQNIQLIVREAGKVLIQVIDDGSGMSATDARMSFERHATSKIRTSDDLFKIRTMGFRGEALASIAAVAQVEMRTRRATDELGSFLKIEASETKAQEAIAAPVGTNIQVKNLFFNVPARRNFLKSNPVEMRHIIDEFQRVALANPEVGFILYHNEQEVYSLAGGKLSKRIIELFGRQYREQLGVCQEETPFVAVSGYIGNPSSAKKTRGDQFFFANNRYIRHNYLHHAVLSAFEGLIPENTHPFYVLFIEIDPIHIDINVHPTKTEIKFDDERSVYAIVQAAVRRAMNAYNLTPSIDFDSDVSVNFGFLATDKREERSDSQGFKNDYQGSEASPLQKKNLSNWSKLYEGLSNGFENEAPARKAESNWNFDWKNLKAEPEPQPEPTLTFVSKANPRKEGVNLGEFTDRNCYQIHNRFVISQTQEGILLIDQRAAYERILFDKYQNLLEKRNGASQQLLFPKTVKFNPADFHLIMEMSDEIHALGFMFSQIGQSDVLVTGIPTDVQDENEQKLFEELLEQFKFFANDLKISRRESLARSFAKRSASRYTQTLSQPEMSMIIDQLLEASNAHYTPSGEPILKVLDLDFLAKVLKG